jgi:hypothetical protein
MAMTDYVTNLAFFLQERTGSVCGIWRGRLSAVDQRALFGRYLGKGLLVIDGEQERIKMIVTVCFGTDWDTREDLAWRELDGEQLRQAAYDAANARHPLPISGKE